MPDLSHLNLNALHPEEGNHQEDQDDFLTFDNHQEDPLDFYDAYFDSINEDIDIDIDNNDVDEGGEERDEEDEEGYQEYQEDGDDERHQLQEPTFRMPIPHRPSPILNSLPSSSSFAPPFYNRPPTPLPPSPSLTSLLRPTFSSNGTSRPTSPDSSDDVDADTNNDTEAVVAKSARIATTVPRASPKVPTYEYYGFVLYLASSLAFLIYLLWSYLPSPFLHQLGIYYYPNRWWSLAIPAYLVMSIVYVYVALAAYNTGYLTLPMKSIENIVDEAANIAVIDGKGRRRGKGSEKVNPNSVTWVTMGAGAGAGAGVGIGKTMAMGMTGNGNGNGVDWEGIWSEGTDAVMDIPVGGVCEVLYGRGGGAALKREKENENEIEMIEDVVYTGDEQER